jgi:hypothetical protein
MENNTKSLGEMLSVVAKVMPPYNPSFPLDLYYDTESKNPLPIKIPLEELEENARNFKKIYS